MQERRSQCYRQFRQEWNACEVRAICCSRCIGLVTSKTGNTIVIIFDYLDQIILKVLNLFLETKS